MDALHGLAPSWASVADHPARGMIKGMVYSGVFMGGLYAFGAIAEVPLLRSLAADQPVLAATLLGALAFPLIKTIIETFDGSQAFFRRVSSELSQPGPLPAGRGRRPGPGVWADPGDGREGRCRPASGSAWRSVRSRSRGSNFLRDAVRSVPRTGAASSRGGSTWCMRCWAASSARRIGFYLDATQVGGGRRQVPPLPRRGPRRPSRSTSTRCSASGASQPGDGHRRREPAVRARRWRA